MTRRASTGDATIRRGDRAAILGRTGSGKSVLLRHLLARYSRAVLVDPKGRAAMDGWPIVYGSRDFLRRWPAEPRMVIRPGAGEERRSWLDAIAWHVYTHGETGFGVDEVVGVVDANKGAPGFDAVLTQGRELGITALVCSQRPARIPSPIVSEADHVFVFTLNLADDRKRVSETIGPYPNPADRSYRFVYWTGELDGPIECAPLNVRADRGDPAPATPESRREDHP